MTTKSEPEVVDMSPHAILQRLEIVRALYKLSVSLMSIDTSKAVPVDPKRR